MAKFVAPDGREYPITLGEITNREAKLLQETTGMRYITLVADLERFGPDGMAAFWWLAMRKADHHVKFEDLEFPMGKLKFITEDEVDPTKGSSETPTPEQSSSPTSTKSPAKTSGRRSKPS